jgi:hypothetical protein
MKRLQKERGSLVLGAWVMIPIAAGVILAFAMLQLSSMLRALDNSALAFAVSMRYAKTMADSSIPVVTTNALIIQDSDISFASQQQWYSKLAAKNGLNLTNSSDKQALNLALSQLQMTGAVFPPEAKRNPATNKWAAEFNGKDNSVNLVVTNDVKNGMPVTQLTVSLKPGLLERFARMIGVSSPQLLASANVNLLGSQYANSANFVPVTHFARQLPDATLVPGKYTDALVELAPPVKDGSMGGGGGGPGAISVPGGITVTGPGGGGVTLGS